MKLQLWITCRIGFSLLKLYVVYCGAIESLKNELELRFAEEQEQTSFTHAQQLQAAKMELDRALHLIRQKVFIHLHSTLHYATMAGCSVTFLAVRCMQHVLYNVYVYHFCLLTCKL